MVPNVLNVKSVDKSCVVNYSYLRIYDGCSVEHDVFYIGGVKVNKSFDWMNFKMGDFVVYCRDKKEITQFLQECDKQGLKWANGAAATDFIPEHPNVCIECDDLRLHYARRRLYEEIGNEVIDYNPEMFKDVNLDISNLVATKMNLSELTTYETSISFNILLEIVNYTLKIMNSKGYHIRNPKNPEFFIENVYYDSINDELYCTFKEDSK